MLSEERAFQAEDTDNAKVLKWEHFREFQEEQEEHIAGTETARQQEMRSEK